MRYCRYKGIMCEFATEYGYCQLTGCVKHERLNECDMLEGNINRMMVTKDKKELRQMYEYAERRLHKIYKARFAELDDSDMREGQDGNQS